MGSAVIVVFVILTTILSFGDMVTNFVMGWQLVVERESGTSLFYKPRTDQLLALIFVMGPGLLVGFAIIADSHYEDGYIRTTYYVNGSRVGSSTRPNNEIDVVEFIRGAFFIAISPLLLPLLVAYCGIQVLRALCGEEDELLRQKITFFVCVFLVESIVVSNTLALVQLVSISQLNEWDFIRADAALSSLAAVAWATALIPWSVTRGDNDGVRLGFLELLFYVLFAFWIFVHLLVIYVPVCFIAGQNGNWGFAFGSVYFPVHFILFIIILVLANHKPVHSFVCSIVHQLLHIVFCMFFLLCWFGGYIDYFPRDTMSAFSVQLWNDTTLPWMRDLARDLSGASNEVNGTSSAGSRDLPAWNTCSHVNLVEDACLMNSAGTYFVFLFFVIVFLFLFNIVVTFLFFGKMLLSQIKSRIFPTDENTNQDLPRVG